MKFKYTSEYPEEIKKLLTKLFKDCNNPRKVVPYIKLFVTSWVVKSYATMT
jgi:hypothetical protein